MVELEFEYLSFFSNLTTTLYWKAEKQVIKLPCKESEIEELGLYLIFIRGTDVWGKIVTQTQKHGTTISNISQPNWGFSCSPSDTCLLSYNLFNTSQLNDYPFLCSYNILFILFLMGLLYSSMYVITVFVNLSYCSTLPTCRLWGQGLGSHYFYILAFYI